MTLQYIRKVSLVTASASGTTVDLSEMHFKFSVSRGDLQTPNTADIRVYNLSDKTINFLTGALKKEYIAITLQAGYEGSFGIIFQGTVKQLRSGRETPTDTYLDITAADGDGAYNFAVVNTSIAKGRNSNDHVNALIQTMNPYGVTAGSINGLSTNGTPRGKVMFGLARDHLRKIANSSQTAWSMQNGQVSIIPLNNFTPAPAIAINSATGMIGLPEQTQYGIKVKTLLNPSILIGGQIKINNKDIQQFRFPVGFTNAKDNALLALSIHTNADGAYKVLWVDYDGDTRGQEWYCEITCQAIDAVLGQQQITNPKNVPGGLGAEGPLAPVNAYAPGDNFPGQN